MDGITRKRMQCDSHIAKIGYFGWKKVWRGTGEGRRSMYRHSRLPPYFICMVVGCYCCGRMMWSCVLFFWKRERVWHACVRNCGTFISGGDVSCFDVGGVGVIILSIGG